MTVGLPTVDAGPAMPRPATLLIVPDPTGRTSDPRLDFLRLQAEYN